MENVWLLGYFGLFIASTLIVGTFLTDRLAITYSSVADAVLTRWAVGCVVAAYWFMGWGAAHMLYPVIIFGGYIVPVIAWSIFVLLKPVKGKELTRTFRLLWVEMNSGDLLILGALAVLLLPLLGFAFLLPVGWDAVAYHLMLPKFYLTAHGLDFVSWFPQTAFPMAINGLFGLGEVVGDPRLSSFQVLSFVLAIPLYMVLGLRGIFADKVRWLAAAITIFLPIIYTETAYAPGVDYPLAFFALLSFITLAKYLKKPSYAHFVLAALFATFCGVIKVSGLFVTGTVLLVLVGQYLFSTVRHSNREVSVSKMTGTIVVLSMPVVYWYLRTWILAHNPVYPFLNSFFKGFDYDPAAVDLLKDDIQKVTGAIRPVFTRYHHSAESVDDILPLSEVVFILGLLIGGVSTLFMKIAKLWKVIALVVLITAMPVLILVGPLQRYYLFLVPILSLLTMASLFSLRDKWSSRRLADVVFLMVMVLWLGLGVDATFKNRNQEFVRVPLRVWFSYFSYSEAKQHLFIQDNHAVTHYANTHLNTRHHKILQAFDNRLYYLTIPAEYANPTLGSYLTNMSTKNAVELVEQLKVDGFTHLIVNTNWGMPPNVRQEIVAELLTPVHVTPLFTSRKVTLYELN